MTNHVNLSTAASATSDTPVFKCIYCARPTEDNDSDSWLRRPRNDWYFHRSIESRRGNRNSRFIRFSAGSVVEQAADRYFRLMDKTQAELKGRFSPTEFTVIFERIRHQWVWEDDIATQLLYKFNQNDKRDAGLNALADRIEDLSLLELSAFVDACERVSHGNNKSLL